MSHDRIFKSNESSPARGAAPHSAFAEQRRRLDALEQFAGGVAHDFNNLLTVILSYADLLGDALAENDARRRMALQIRDTSLRAAEFTRQLLAFAGRQPLKPRLVDAEATMRDLAGPLGRALGEAVRLSIRPALGPALLHADPDQLEAALLQLAANARQAMPQGGEATVALDETQLAPRAAKAFGVAPGRYLRIAMSDTGCGMAPEAAARAFEPFFTTKDAGKGLGLSMVYGFVKQSGGHVEIVSAPGEGTTASLWLPRAEGPQIARRPSLPATAMTQS